MLDLLRLLILQIVHRFLGKLKHLFLSKWLPTDGLCFNCFIRTADYIFAYVATRGQIILFRTFRAEDIANAYFFIWVLCPKLKPTKLKSYFTGNKLSLQYTDVISAAYRNSSVDSVDKKNQRSIHSQCARYFTWNWLESQRFMATHFSII